MGLSSVKVGRAREETKDLISGKGIGPALNYLFKRPQVLAVMLVKSGICLTAGGVWLLSVVYGLRVFPMGKDGTLSVGLLYCAHGLGAIVGASLTSRFFRAKAMHPVRAILVAFLLRGGFFLFWAFSPNLGLAALAIMSVTACGSLLWVLSTTLLQRLTPDEIRGRLFALENGMLTFAMAVSISVIGRSLDLWGLSPSATTLWTAAMAFIIAMGWLVVLFFWERWEHL